MKDQVTKGHSRRAASAMFLGVSLSVVWWTLAVTRNQPGHPDFTMHLIYMLGGFLPAAIGLLCLQATMRSARLRGERSFWWLIGSGGLPVLITLFYLSQVLMQSALAAPAWFYHPGVLVFNLMVALLAGPIAGALGVNLRGANFLKAEIPADEQKAFLAFTWWAWHLPFIFVNGSALTALNLPISLMAAYLVTILAVSWRLSWGIKD